MPNQLPSNSSHVSIREAADSLGVSLKTLRRWESHGLVHPIRNDQNQRVYSAIEIANLDNRKYKPLPENSIAPQNQLSISQAADELGVSIKTLRRWDAEGKIQPLRDDLNRRIFTPEQITAIKTNRSQFSQSPQDTQPIIVARHLPSRSFPAFAAPLLSLLPFILVAAPILVFSLLGYKPSVPLQSVSFNPATVQPLNPDSSTSTNTLYPTASSSAYSNADTNPILRRIRSEGEVAGLTVTGGSFLSFENVLDDNYNFGVAGTIEGNQIISSTTVKAPFVVGSQEKVTNLNADLLDGHSWEEIESVVIEPSSLQKSYEAGNTITTTDKNLEITLSGSTALAIGGTGAVNFNTSGQTSFTGNVRAGSGLTVIGNLTLNSVPSGSDSRLLTVNSSSGLVSYIDTASWDKSTTDDLSTSTSYAGDVSGLYNNLQLGSGVVGSTEISDASVAEVDLSISNAPVDGYFLQTNGSGALSWSNSLNLGSLSLNGSLINATATELNLLSGHTNVLLDTASISATIQAYNANTSLLGQTIDGTEFRLGSDTAGDLIYFNGTNWVRLPGSGTDGFALKYNTATNIPYWAADAGGTSYTASNGVDLVGADFQLDFTTFETWDQNLWDDLTFNNFSTAAASLLATWDMNASDDVTAASVGATVQAYSTNTSLLGQTIEESELNITNGPSNGYFLQTDGSGNLTWVDISGMGGGSGDSYLSLTAEQLHPTNTALDFLLGGTSTAAATIALQSNTGNIKATSADISSIRVSGTTVGLTSDTDLLSMSAAALTINGTLEVISSITAPTIGTINNLNINNGAISNAASLSLQLAGNTWDSSGNLNVSNDLTTTHFYTRDTNQSNTLQLRWNEDDTANRVLDFYLAGANRQLTLNENFTIGDGSPGILTYTNAATLTVESNANLNQDLTTDASPTFAGLTLSTLSAIANNRLLNINSSTGVVSYIDSTTWDMNATDDVTIASVGATVQAYHADTSILGQTIEESELNIGNAPSAGFVLQTDGSGNMTWSDPGGSSTNYWLQTDEQLYSKNALWHDLLIGGTSTAAATIALQANTGNIKLSSINTAISSTELGLLDGRSGTLLDSNNVATQLSGWDQNSSDDVTDADTLTWDMNSTDDVTVASVGATVQAYNADTSFLGQTIEESELNISNGPVAGYVLQTAGDGTLTWVDPSLTAEASNYWLQTNEQIYAKNALWNDLLIGGTSTDSATIALQANTGTIIAGNILPKTNDTFDLGSDTARFKDLYLGGDTLHLGTSLTDEGTLSYDTATNVLGFSTDSTSNGDIAFFTDDLYLDKSTGNVGIGTTNPTASLDIYGGSNVVGNPVFTGTGLDDATSGGQESSSTGHTYTVIIQTSNGINTSTLNNGGSGYAVNDFFTVNGGSTPATGFVAAVSGGVVTSYFIFSTGSGYTVANNVATTKATGNGTGLTINITEVVDGFKWKVDSGSYTGHSAIITTSPQTLSNGITVTFGSSTGHTVNDQWVITSTTTNPTFNLSNGGYSSLVAASNGFVGIGTTTPTGSLDIAGGSAATEGNDQVINGTFDADSDWTKGTGWSIGSGVATKIAGTGADLSQDISVIAGNLYHIRFNYTRTAGLLGVYININSNGTYYSSASGTVDAYIYANTTGLLRFSTDSSFAGTIDNVVVTPVNTSLANTVNRDSEGAVNNEIRIAGTGNLFHGFQSGQYNTTGTFNSSFGGGALSFNTTGTNNTALGASALAVNYTGSKNTSIGQGSGGNMFAGEENTFIGYRAGSGQGNFTAANYNTIIGSQAGRNITTGASNNILLGYKAGDALSTGSTNIVIGKDIDLPTVSSSNMLDLGNLIYATGLTSTGTTISTGSVGIGNAAPSYKLDVAGDINSSTGTYRLAGADVGQYFIDSAGSTGNVWMSDGSGRGGWANTTSWDMNVWNDITTDNMGTQAASILSAWDQNSSDDVTDADTLTWDMNVWDDLTFDNLATAASILATWDMNNTDDVTIASVGATVQAYNANTSFLGSFVDESELNISNGPVAGYVLQTAGDGTLTWVDPSLTAEASNYWLNTNEQIYAKNALWNDLLVGGTSTSAATIALQANTGNIKATSLNLGTGNLSLSGTTLGLSTDTDLLSLASGALTVNGSLTTVGNILPSADDTYDLGSTTARFKDLYLGGETLHLGSSLTDEATISYTSSNILSFGTDSTTNGDIAFFTDDLYLDKSTGYVGIGTTDPTAMLDVVGDASASGSLVLRDASLNTIDALNGGRLAFNTSVGGDTELTERMTILNNGNVGIGTNNPTSKFYVNGSSFINGNISQSANSYLNFQGHGTVSAWNTLYLGGVGAIHLNLAYDGNVMVGSTSQAKLGVGTSAPVGRLHVRGAVTGKALAIFDEIGNQDLFTASASGVTKFTIANNGDLDTTGTYKMSGADVGQYFITSAGNNGQVWTSDGSGVGGWGDLGTNTTFSTWDMNATDDVTIASVGATVQAYHADTSLLGQSISESELDISNSVSNGYVLQTDGSGVLSWVDLGLSASNYWLQTDEQIYAKNALVMDLLIGSTSTAAATIALQANTGNIKATSLNLGTGNLSLTGTTLGISTDTDLLSLAANNLTINGSASMSGSLTIGQGQTLKSAYGPLSLAYKSAADTWTTGLTLQDGTGNVGIGTTSPTQKLDVAGRIFADSEIRVDNGAYYGQFLGSNLTLYNDSTHRVYLDVNSNSYIMGPNFGIGITNPGYKLDVTGDINISSGQAYRINGTDVSQYFITAAGNNGEVWTSDGSGVGGWGDLGTNTAFSTWDMNATDDVTIASVGATVQAYNADTSFLGQSVSESELDISNGPAEGYILQTAVDGTLTWIDPSTFGGGANYFQLVNEQISPTNALNFDLLIGGDSTSAATIALQANTGTIIAGNILPKTNDTYDLGSDTARFRDLYLGANTLHIGSSTTDEYTIAYNTNDNYLGFNINGSGDPEFVFDAAGNLGIGVINPTSKVDIKGDPGLSVFNVASSSGDSLFNVAANGNIGIGTTNPQHKLSIGGTSSIISNNSGDLTFDSASNNLSFSGDNLTNITDVIIAGDAEISANALVNGQIGIGTVSPVAKLDVSGAIVGKALTILNELGNQDILTASASGNTVLRLTNAGNFVLNTDAYLNFGNDEGSDGHGIRDNSGTLEFKNTDGDWTEFGSGTGLFQLIDEQISANNALNYDLLVGGVSTDTATIALQAATGAVKAVTGYFSNKLGVGTVNPTAKFEVTGAATGKALTIFDETGDQSIITASASGTTRWTLDRDGSISQASSDTTGIAYDLSVNNLTSGIGLNLTSISTDFSSGSLANLDWSPSGSTQIYATGDLLRINLGEYGNVGNLLNITDNGSTLFSVSETTITSALPHNFSAVGDVSIANDLVFTNQSASNITTDASFTIDVGETYESNNLTLKTHNSGNILLNPASGSVVVGTDIIPTALFEVNGDKVGKALAILNETGDQDILTASASGTTRMVLTSAGNLGLGVAQPTAILSLAAATTAKPQINLVSSATVNPSSPANGDLWWNGTNLNFYDGSSTKDLLDDGGTVYTADNGITLTADNFALGGNLTANTTITQDSAESLSFVNAGTANTIFNLSSTGDLVIQDNGVTYATFTDAGVFTLDSLNLDGTTIGLTTDTDLLSLASGALTINGTITAVGNILPSANDTYDLGSNTARFKDAYFGGQTVHIGSSQTDEGTISYDNATNIFAFSTDATGNGDISFFTDDMYLDKSTGYIGLGTTTPTAELDVTGTASMSALTIRGSSPGYINQVNGNDLIFRTSVGGDVDLTARMTLSNAGNLGLGTTAPESKLQVSGGGLCVGSDADCNSDNNTEGVIYSSATAMTVYDLAENYPTKDTSLTYQEVVELDPNNGVFVQRATNSYSSKLLGVISEKPAVLLGGFNGEQFSQERQVAIALSGRVPVKVDPNSASIKIGDPLTASSALPGSAIKATQPGYVIGRALTDWNPNQNQDAVMTYVTATYADPTLTFTNTGDVVTLASRVDTLELEATAAKSSLSNLITSISNLFARQTAIETKNSLMESTITDLQSQIASLSANNSTNDVITYEVASISTQVAYIQPQIAGITNEVASVSARVTFLESRPTPTPTIEESRISALETQIASLSASLSASLTTDLSLPIEASTAALADSLTNGLIASSSPTTSLTDSLTNDLNLDVESIFISDFLSVLGDTILTTATVTNTLTISSINSLTGRLSFMGDLLTIDTLGNVVTINGNLKVAGIADIAQLTTLDATVSGTLSAPVIDELASKSANLEQLVASMAAELANLKSQFASTSAVASPSASANTESTPSATIPTPTPVTSYRLIQLNQ